MLLELNATAIGKLASRCSSAPVVYPSATTYAGQYTTSALFPFQLVSWPFRQTDTSFFNRLTISVMSAPGK